MTISPTFTDTISCDACGVTIGLDDGSGFVEMVDGSFITFHGFRLCPPCGDLCETKGHRVTGTCHYSDI